MIGGASTATFFLLSGLKEDGRWDYAERYNKTGVYDKISGQPMAEIDKGLDYSPTSPDMECEAGYTIYQCYNEDLNSAYRSRAAASKPLTGVDAKIATIEFYSFASRFGEWKDANATIAFYEYLAPYLGKIDACLISQYLSTGVHWGSREFGNYHVPEVHCGLTDPNEAYTGAFGYPDRYVKGSTLKSAADQTAYRVFHNVPPVVNFIQRMGDFKQARRDIPINLRTEQERIEMIRKLRDLLKKGIDVMEWVPYLLLGIGAVWVWGMLPKRGD